MDSKNKSNMCEEKSFAYKDTDIAIIGVGLKIADAQNIDDYWSIFENNLECIRDFPEGRKKQVWEYSKIYRVDKPTFYKGTYLEHIDEFDYEYFKITPKEAQVMEPAQRLFLETAIETIDNAGYTEEKMGGTRTGVFVGYSSATFKDSYLVDLAFTNPELIKYGMVANMPCVLPARVSHTLDLKGPAMVIDTACSSSIVVIHEACRSILDNECDMALAGGVKLNTCPIITEESQVGFESNDNKTRAFDDKASGSSFGEGLGCILLKPVKKAIEDKDHIYAVIKGTAINHDGRASGITVPNPVAQTSVISTALEAAQVDVNEIGYVETHGTGTILGDPVEFRGLLEAYSGLTQRKQFCGLSASKSNVGHLYECAGFASLLKAIGAINNKKIPGVKNFLQPNQIINFSMSPFYVNKDTKDWVVEDGKLRTCGISSFGISGTNGHIILQEYRGIKPEILESPYQIFSLSAKREDALLAFVKKYIDFIEKTEEDIQTVAINANRNRNHFAKRLAIVFENRDDLLQKLKAVYNGDELGTGIYCSKEAGNNPSVDMPEFEEDMLEECNFIWKEKRFENRTYLFDLLNNIAYYYTSGMDINWDSLYKEIEPEKIPLPSYPFKKNHLWMPCEKPANLIRCVDGEFPSLPVDTSNKIYYKRAFVPNDGIEAGNTGDCLVIELSGNKQPEVVEELRQRFQNVYEIILDENMMRFSDIVTYAISQYRKIDYSNVTHIVFVNYYRADLVLDVKELFRIQKVMLLGYQSLLKCLKQSIWNENSYKVAILTDTIFEVTGSEEELHPEFAPVFGFTKALNREFKKIPAVTIDSDAGTSVQSIVDEICAKEVNDIVCYRSNVRYVEKLTEYEISNNNTFAMRDQGVYFISGGAKGIGFEVAKRIASVCKEPVLILMSRTEVPEETEWESVIQANEDKKVIKLIQNIKELKRLGSTVEYFAGDIADDKRVKEVFSQIKAKYAQINGVVHGAGIGGGCTFDELDQERIVNMIRPKILGAFNLSKVTEEEKLDFFVSFSSISTIFSSSDLPHYAAGNMYLDALSRYREKSHPGVNVTVNWATWSETGMSVEHNFTQDTLFKAIKTETGINSLFQLLGKESGSYVIGELNLDTSFGLLIRKYPMELSSYIDGRLKQLEQSQKQKQEQVKNQAVNNVSYNEYGIVERKLCSICCDILGYDVINLLDNFFELGADSILLGHLFNAIDKEYPGLLQVTDLFERPTIKTLADYISELTGITDEAAVTEEIEPEPESVDSEDNDVAIIGVGMNLPGAGSLEEYWEMLINGISAIREIPEERGKDIEKHIQFTRHTKERIKFRRMAYLDEINKFDYGYFGISPREASLIDPVNRLFLQCCATAIDDAGYGRDKIKGTKTGVFLGYSANIGNAYSRLLLETSPELFNASLPLNQISMTASKVAYTFDLLGPSMVIDTACSSSLVSLYTACEQIRQKKCSMALAGGGFLSLSPIAEGYSVGFESEENKTRAFAEGATGSAIGEGVGVVLLKSLKEAIKDKDDIYAVIKGGAVNQDGNSFGIAAPNYLAQSEVIQEAWKDAKVSAKDISYMEAHGTGTALGDPIEIKAIRHAFETVGAKKQMCGIGSLKCNIGHLNEASGISGILKMILVLKNKEIPPTINMLVPNSNIDFSNSPLYLVTKRTPLEAKNGDTSFVGISGFGMSGTNCHFVLSNAPEIEFESKEEEQNILTISAQSVSPLKALFRKYLDFLEEHETINLTDFCYNINTARHHQQYRVAFVFKDRDELLEKLKNLEENYPYIIDAKGYYIGNYHIVPEYKENRLKHEITIMEQKEFTEQGNKELEKYSKSKEPNVLFEVLENYVRGGMIDWNLLYEEERRKLHLPTYSYEKNYCWYKVNEVEEVQEKQAEVEDIEPIDSYFYYKKWVPFECTETITFEEKDVILLIHDTQRTFGDLHDKIDQRGCVAIDVFEGTSNSKNSDSSYTVTPDLAGYQFLLHDLGERNIKQIVHMKALSKESANESTLIDQRVNQGFFDLIEMIKAVSMEHIKNKFDILIVSNNAYEISGEEAFYVPENATILSLGKVIEQEYNNIGCRALDLELTTSTDFICKEIFANTNLYMTGYRNNVRYAEELNEAVMESESALFKDNGVYVITGGTSGIGLETAKYVSEQTNGHIIIISRSGFKANDEKEKEVYQYITGNLCTLDVFACDVKDYDSLKTTLDEVRSKYGRINGVIHSAGISGAGYILRKDRESYYNVFSPKIFGTWNLHQCTLEDKLDFMVLFSSEVTDAGEAGQSDYVAANSYLDAFGDYRNALGLKTKVVNWVSWKETGMSVRHGINHDSATKAITTEEGICALDQFIKSSYTRVMIGQFNVNENFVEISKYSRNLASDEFSGKVAKLREVLISSQDSTNLNDGTRNFAQIKDGKVIYIPKSDKASKKKDLKVRLKGEYQDKYNEYELVIGSIYGRILGYEEINIFDNFFELGGDSVMLSEMHEMIETNYPDIIMVADLFQYTSVKLLADYIASCYQKPEKEENKVTEEPVTEEESSMFEATLSQQRIYFDTRVTKNKLKYNNPFLMNISAFDGDVEPVLKELVNRYEILSCYVKMSEGKLMLCKEPEVKIKVDYVDVEDINDVDYHQYLTAFNLKKAPLFHFTLFRTKTNEKVFLFDVHHLLVDGYSSSILQNDFKALAHGETLPDKVYQYREYSKFLQQFTESKQYKDMEDYWVNRLSDFAFTSNIEAKEDKDEIIYTSSIKEISNQLSQELKTMAKQYKVSFFSLLYSAASLAFMKECRNNDVVFLVSTLNRYKPKYMQMVGMFTNYVPIRVKLEGETELEQFILHTAKNIELDYCNQFCDFSTITSLLHKENAKVDSASFLFGFDFEDESLRKVGEEKDTRFNSNLGKLDIEFFITSYGNGYQLKVNYKSNKYNKGQIDNLISNTLICLENIAKTNDSFGTMEELIQNLKEPYQG